MSITYTLKEYPQGKIMIGDRIRWLRNKNSMTQADLAERLNMSDQQILRWENGKSDPSADAIIKLAKLFDVTGDYLLCLTDDPRGNMATELTQLEWDMIQAFRQSNFKNFSALLHEGLKQRDE
jgi:transcriptional regulator with XRE-family HTH domain